MRWARIVGLGLVLVSACSALGDDLRRAQTAFEAARYEDVEVWLDALEPDVARMRPEERVRFYYLRGTTAYRLSEQRRARHYLALARVESERAPAALTPAWEKELDRMLDKLAPEANFGDQAGG